MEINKNYHLETSFFTDEFWYGGIVDMGIHMPIHKESKQILDISDSWQSLDQSAPLLLSSKGRYLWSNEPFQAIFDQGEIFCKGSAPIILSEGHDTLKGAYMDACKKYFPPSYELPDETFFRVPQYNTWIELQYNQSQEGVLKYADGILENGMPTGIIMIDDGWSEDYGVWEFHNAKFPNPKEMVQKLHEKGFKVMLWVIPVVSPDSAVFRDLRKKDLLLKNTDGSIYIREWWNGYSAVLDLKNPEAWTFFKDQLDSLQKRYHVDGFKFDGGDAYFYEASAFSKEYTTLYNKFALQYSFNELRAAYNFAGRGLVTRLQDKHHSWNESGINCLIPNSLIQSLLGYSYSCPDMIGGGDVGSDYTKVDEELIVRYAQISALMPMMQFSLAPWRVLSEKNMEIVKAAALLHAQYGEYIFKYAKEASKTGIPILRHMEFEYPNEGFEQIIDQFMLGDDILVAPVVNSCVYRRNVKLPNGLWKDEEGFVYQGGCQVEIDAPIEKLIYFKKVK